MSTCTRHHRANPTSSDTNCRQGTAAVTRPSPADRTHSGTATSQDAADRTAATLQYKPPRTCIVVQKQTKTAGVTGGQHNLPRTLYRCVLSDKADSECVFYRTGTCSINRHTARKKTLGTWVQAKRCMPLRGTTNQGVVVQAGRALRLAALAVGVCTQQHQASAAEGHCHQQTNQAHFYKHEPVALLHNMRMASSGRCVQAPPQQGRKTVQSVGQPGGPHKAGCACWGKRRTSVWWLPLQEHGCCGWWRWK